MENKISKRIGMEDRYQGWNMHLYLITEKVYKLIGTQNIWYTSI